MAETVNCAKPSSKELCEIFGTHISEKTLVLTDGLRSYNSLESVTGCTVVDVYHEESKKLFNLNMVLLCKTPETSIHTFDTTINKSLNNDLLNQFS